MKLRDDFEGEMPYLLDTKDGQFCSARMDPRIAEEIVHTHETIALCDLEGYELVVNGRMLFPISAFEFDEGEAPTKRVKVGVKPRPKATVRDKRTKAELREVAKLLGIHVTTHMTKAVLLERIAEAEARIVPEEAVPEDAEGDDGEAG